MGGVGVDSVSYINVDDQLESVADGARGTYKVVKVFEHKFRAIPVLECEKFEGSGPTKIWIVGDDRPTKHASFGLFKKNSLPAETGKPTYSVFGTPVVKPPEFNFKLKTD